MLDATPLQGYLSDLEAAQTASDARDWPTAASRWEAVVNANPVNGAHWLRLADARYQAGADSTAVAAYEHAFRLGTVGEVDGSDLGSGFPFDITYRLACC